MHCMPFILTARMKNGEDDFGPAEIIDGIRQLYKVREGLFAPFSWFEEFHFRLDDIYTRLKVVSRNKVSGTATSDTVNMSEVLKPHEECPQPRTVLIEGKPGMGKTTYCKKLVYDWATEKAEDCFPRFEAVLLLRCRDVKSDLWEAIDEQLLPRDVKEEERERFFDFIRRNQSNVLLILDGLDEVAVNKLPMFSEIIQGRVLPKCRLLFTARHEAGIHVRRYCDTLLEVEGFTEEAAQNFVRKYFMNMEDVAQTLLYKLEHDENIKEMAANPFNIVLLCLFCEDFQGVFPERRTTLYWEIVRCFLRRYMEKNGLSEGNEDLIETYKTQLKHLGRIALKGLGEGNLDFDESELGSYSAELPGFGFLSFLVGSKLRPRLRFSFLHKSFQEVFAAFYLNCQLLDKEISADSLVADRIYFHKLKGVIPLLFGMLIAQCQETAVALITSISIKFYQAVKTDGDDFLHVLLECIKECNEGLSKAAVANAVGSVLQLPTDSLATLSESLKQWKRDNNGGEDKITKKVESKIGNMTIELDTLVTQSQETKDEDQARHDFEEMRNEIQNITEKLTSREVATVEVDETSIVKATEQFEAKHAECVRVCPYFKHGKVVVHLYVYSGESGIPTALKTAAQETFGKMGLELEWSDLYNDSYNVLNVTPIEYPSGEPKRLEAHQVDEIDEIINKHLHDFSKHRNITALQPSFKVTKSVQTEQACITVYVLGKGRIPVGESTIPSTIGPYPVDIVNGFFVRTKRPTEPIEAQKRQEVLCLGASIGIDGEQSSGTLGAIVEYKNSDKLYILSNDHVMRRPGQSEIIHPGLDAYLNYLHYHLVEYRNWISRIPGLQVPQISDNILRERETLSNKFDELKSIRVQHRAPPEIPEDTWKKILELEEAFEKCLRPRKIANFSAGVRCNVLSATTGFEHFIDAGISELNEDEAKKLRCNKTIRIIGTGYYPSGECIPAKSVYSVKNMFKSGSGTGYTESNCGLVASPICPPMTIQDSRQYDETAWVDVDCIKCKSKKQTESGDQGSQSSVQALSPPCTLCKPDRWMKRCLCIRPQRFQPFSGGGDSGAVVFERRSNESAHPAFGIIFGIFPSGNHVFSLASPLEIAIEELSKKVSSSRPQGSQPCKLRLVSSLSD